MVFEGRVYRRGRIVDAEVGVDEGGIIVAVGKSVRGGKRRSLGDLVMLPSAIDLHVHFREPGGRDEVENYESGTRGAALGGVGAAVDMPNTEPPTTTAERVVDKISRIKRSASIDILPYAALTPDSMVARLGMVAAGFKLYMAPTTGGLDLKEGTPLSRLLSEVDATGLPLHVHAEDPKLINTEARPMDTDAWDRVRPAASELSAISMLSRRPQTLRMHVCHVTTAEANEAARRIGASTESTPHHLLLSSSQFGVALCKVNPPLRAEPVRKELFEAFRTGKVTMLASDHAPHSLSMKEGPFPLAPSGVPGVQTMLPLMLELVHRGELELGRLVNAACRDPALFLGLPRGRLEKGLEANFITVDFRRSRKIRGKDLASPCGWTPFEGRVANFPVDQYLLGTRVVEDGEFVGGLRGRALRAAPLTRGSRRSASR